MQLRTVFVVVLAVLLMLLTPTVGAQTDEIKDTLSGNAAYRIMEYDIDEGVYQLQFVWPSDSVCELFYPYNEATGGFLSGTRDTLTVVSFDTSYTANIAQHGIRMLLPPVSETDFYYLDEVMVFFAEGTRFMGGRHPYHVHLYQTQFNGAPIGDTARFRQPFDFSYFPIGWNPEAGGRVRIPFVYGEDLGPDFPDPYRLYGGDTTYYSVMVEVANPGSPDSLNLVYLSNHCVPTGYPEGLIYLVDPVEFTYSGFGNFSSFYGLRNAYQRGELTRYSTAPAIIPILFRYSPGPVARPHHTIGKTGGLELMAPYPNPAVDFTHLRFRLDHSDEVTLRIMDGAGRIVQEERFAVAAGETTRQLDTRSLACGSYSLLVQTHQGAMGTKLLIER